MCPVKPVNKKLSFVPKREPFKRNTDNYKLYNTHKWRKLRRIFLNANPLCVACKSKGFKKPATVVDHVVRYKEGDDFYDESNWQPMCAKHHNEKSAAESRGMGHKHDYRKYL